MAGENYWSTAACRTAQKGASISYARVHALKMTTVDVSKRKGVWSNYLVKKTQDPFEGPSCICFQYKDVLDNCGEGIRNIKYCSKNAWALRGLQTKVKKR